MLPDEIRDDLIKSIPAILNIRDICLILDVSASTVRREIKRRGGLPGYLVEGEWNVARADFLAYLARNATF